jgi:hypothetical protein
VYAEHGSEFAAGGDAVAGPEIACVNQSTELVTKLDVEGNVAFRL